MFEFLMSLVESLFSVKSFNLARNQAKSKAISSLKNALRLTEKHIKDTQTDEEYEDGLNDVESKELSAAWSNVAQSIRPFNPRLAQTFEDKSDYWINPLGFGDEIRSGNRRFDYKMRLFEVKREIAKIEKKGF